MGGLLKEILIDRTLFGDKIDPRIIPIAACNPYKFKENKDTFTAGLKHVKSNESSMKLVYLVYPMPESIFYFVWNYDTLELKDEYLYIRNILILKNEFKE